MMTTHNFKGFKPPKIPEKGAWLGTFQPNWQNHKIAISPTSPWDRQKIGTKKMAKPHYVFFNTLMPLDDEIR